MVLTEPRNPINMGNRGVGTFASRAHTPTINLALMMVREKSVIVGGFHLSEGGLVLGLIRALPPTLGVSAWERDIVLRE